MRFDILGEILEVETFARDATPWQSHSQNSWSYASTTRATRHRLRSGRSMLRFATRLPRSMDCFGLSMNPVMITFIQRCSSTRSHCHRRSGRQCWRRPDDARTKHVTGPTDSCYSREDEFPESKGGASGRVPARGGAYARNHSVY